MNELHLFAGAGGGILGGELLGHKTVCAVELEEYPRKVLLQRQRDGILPWFPIWDDIITFDGRPWEGSVDIVSGGFPCQDISAAGKGAGINGERSGLWGEMARVVCEISPRFVFVENSPMLTSRGLHRVLGDLAEMGYNARWCVLGADDAGAPHRRKRVWILAYTPESGFQKWSGKESGKTGETDEFKRCGEDVGYPNKTRLERSQCTGRINQKGREIQNGCSTKSSRISWWDTDPADLPDADSFGQVQCEPRTRQRKGILENGSARAGREKHDSLRGESETRTTKPHVGRVAHGVAKRVDRLKAIGNGQVPAVAAIAFTLLSEGLV